MKLLSCEFNMYTACVELKLAGGRVIPIDTISAENEVADNMYERSELNYLICNAPLEYDDLILNGNLGKYLKAATQYKPFGGGAAAVVGISLLAIAGYSV